MSLRPIIGKTREKFTVSTGPPRNTPLPLPVDGVDSEAVATARCGPHSEPGSLRDAPRFWRELVRLGPRRQLAQRVRVNPTVSGVLHRHSEPSHTTAAKRKSRPGGPSNHSGGGVLPNVTIGRCSRIHSKDLRRLAPTTHPGISITASVCYGPWFRTL
jgi:hypothetical protein